MRRPGVPLGGDALCAELERTAGPPDTGGADARRLLGTEPVPRHVRTRSGGPGPAGRGAEDDAFGHATATQVRSLLADATHEAEFARPNDPAVASAPQTWDADARSDLRLLRRVGVADPSSIDDYRAHGGYEALRRAHALGSGGMIREITDARLMGRGGAAFPTGVKWKAVAEQPVRPHYFICNADESEPGTFKDRVVMEQDPFAVVEALTIAGYATGCERGYIYVRGEYPLATTRLRHAIAEARRHGFLGDDVMGEGFAFDIELRRGAGAYICGEETALFNSIEGKRGEPRNKPPFPVQRGVFGKPTGINNVETLINVLEILRIGGPGVRRDRHGRLDRAAAVLRQRDGGAPRPLRGRVRRDAARGPGAGRRRPKGHVKAILLGGAAGGFVTPDDLDIKLTFEDARAGGYTLGSGVVMVFERVGRPGGHRAADRPVLPR